MVGNWFLLVFIAAILGYAVVSFGFQTVHMVGPSMEPTLMNGDTLLLVKPGAVKRFDIVAIKKMDTDQYFEIKRVIGLPGETVRISNGSIYINGEKLETDLYQDRIRSGGVAQSELELGENEYFVLGDNVNNSEDSRFGNIGNIGKSEIVGRVRYVIAPAKRRGKVK